MKHVRRRARFQQHGDASCHQVPPPRPPARRGAEGNHAILTETFGEHAPSYATSKTRWSSSNVVIFPPVMRLVLDDPKQ